MTELPLTDPKIQNLLALTNRQFDAWREIVLEETKINEDDLRSGELMDLWFILSNLAMEKEQKINKKDAYRYIKSMKEETARQYVARTQKLGLTRTVIEAVERRIELTEAGRRAITRIMNRWLVGFSEIEGS